MAIRIKTVSNGLQLTVRPSINWLTVGSQLLVAVIVFGVGLEPALERIRSSSRMVSDVAGLGVLVLIFGAILVFLLYSCASMLFGYERIIVSSTEVVIESWLAGIHLGSRTFPDNTVENLRYEDWPGGRAGEQRAIRFECAGETVTFARQASSSDCYDAIDRMRSVYHFPASESGDDDSDDPITSPAVTNW